MAATSGAMHTYTLATLLIHLLSALPCAVLADNSNIYPGKIVQGVIVSDGIDFESYDYDDTTAAAALPDATATVAGLGARDDAAEFLYDTEVQTDTSISPIEDRRANEPPSEFLLGEPMAEDYTNEDPAAVSARWSGRRLLQ